MSDTFASALPHGAIEEVLPDIFFVTGTVRMPLALPFRFSRNMTVVRTEGRLIIVNSVRLDDAGLAQLDALGRVTDVVRLAGFHGMDDPFYRQRYSARVWAVRGQRYTRGFAPGAAEPYLTPDVEMDASTALPIPGARLHLFGSTPPEALLVLDRDGGVVIAGDALQNWARPDAYFNGVARALMPLMGFMRPHNVGPGWLKQARPPRADLAAVLELSFDKVLPSHGAPVLSSAKEAFRPALERAQRAAL